jgi:hypothetical protein
MKNVIITIACAIAAIIAAGVTNSVSAQKASASVIVDNNMQSLHISSGYPNNIHIKAMRDFLKRNKTAFDANWFTIDNGYEVRYTGRNNSRCRTVYNCHGAFVYTIKQYGEDQMPHEVRSIVKSTYYDYTITLVEEVEQPRAPVIYIIHMQDDTTLKNVTVCDGVMETKEEYKRLLP